MDLNIKCVGVHICHNYVTPGDVYYLWCIPDKRGFFFISGKRVCTLILRGPLYSAFYICVFCGYFQITLIGKVQTYRLLWKMFTSNTHEKPHPTKVSYTFNYVNFFMEGLIKIPDGTSTVFH